MSELGSIFTPEERAAMDAKRTEEAAKQREKARLEDEQRNLEEDRKKTLNIHPFDEQAFLMFNLKKLAPIHNSIHTFVHGTYEKVDLLKGQNTALINRLLNSDFFKKEALLNLTPAQISELVPQIRLFKQYYKPNQDFDKEIELQFPTYIGSVGDVLGDIGRSSYGIQSFDIDSQGTTFFTADKQFTAKLVLYFQSFDQLTAKRTNSDGQQYTFLDLIVQPPVDSPTRANVSDTEPAAPKKHRDVFSDPLAFRIRADLGWAVEPITSNSAFSAKEASSMTRALRNTKISFFLYSTEHEININENGTLTLTVSYIGAFDFAQRDVRAGIILNSALKKELDAISKNIQDATAETPPQKQRVEAARQELISRQTTISKQAFESIVRELMEGVSESVNGSGPTYSKVYQSSISRRAASHFAAYANGVEAPPITITTTEVRETRIGTVGGSQFGPGGVYNAQIKEETVTELNATIDFCDLSWTPIDFVDSGVSYTIFEPVQITPYERVTIEDFKKDAILVDSNGQEYINLSWFYFGDLMEILMKRAFNEQVSDTESLIRRFGSNFSKRVKLILSDIELIDYCTGEAIRVNLAHIPISMKKFTTFFYNKIITTRNLNYTIDDFIRDMLNDLVKDIFLDRSYIAGRKLKQDIKLKYLNLAVYSKEKMVDPLYPTSELVVQPVGDIVRVDSINADNFLRSSTVQSDAENFYFYLMIYQDVYDPQQLVGDYDEYRKKGIPHIFMGRDRGIVKSVSFQRQPIPYQREQRIAQEGKSFDPVVILASLYNVNMETYGNTLFLLGTYFFLLPTGMGGGLGLPNKAGSLANLMGLGGYYFVNKVTWSVSSGKYTTNVEAIHQATGDPSSEANKTLYARGRGLAITDKADSSIAAFG